MEFKLLDRKEFERAIPKLVKLYNECFTGRVDEEYFRWRYLKNPIGDILVCVAIDNGNIIANYAVSPCKISYKNRIVKAALSLNTMTHPNYMGKGIFVKLANMLYDYMEVEGYKFVFGFPNYISNRTFNTKLDWKNIYEIPTMEKNVEKDNYSDVELLSTDNSFELNYTISNIDYDKKIRVIRSEEYIKWRYLENTIYNYQNFIIEDDKIVKANIVCKEYEDKINIVDINYEDLEQAEKMIKNVLKYAKMCNKKYVTIWCNISDKLHVLLERMEFKNNYPITYFGGRILTEDKELSGLLQYCNWLISLSDDNVY